METRSGAGTLVDVDVYVYVYVYVDDYHRGPRLRTGRGRNDVR
ncbi:hypothetical protein [Paraburkholderia phytofirmans]|nr:hypothetical protein [Paraburkholderia phytofirmans]